MSRVKENEEFLESVVGYITTNEILDKNLREGTALTALLDISKSLAVIADAIEAANEEKHKAITELNKRFGVCHYEEVADEDSM